jgi:hypothetical protein
VQQRSSTNNDELLLLTFDAEKAFDKLNHEILFNKLYHNGIKGDMWVLMSIILWSSHSEFASMSMSSAHVGAATLCVPR